MQTRRTRLGDLVRADRQFRRQLAQLGPEAYRPAEVLCRPVLVGSTAGAGERGCLVSSQGMLVAVLVRVGAGAAAAGPEEAEAAAGWFVEAGFGRCAPGGVPPLFGTLREALAWVRHRLALDTAGTAGALRAAFDRAHWLHHDTARVLAETRSTLAAVDRLLSEAGARPVGPDAAGPA